MKSLFTEEFVPFDVVFLMDKLYSVTISSVFFLRILTLLSVLKVNFHLHLMRQTLINSSSQLIGYGVFAGAALVAFASYATLSRGKVSSKLYSMHRSFITLLSLLLGNGKYRHLGGEDTAASTEGIEVFRLMYALFCLLVVLIMLNIAVTILNMYMHEVKTRGRRSKGKEFDYQLSDYVWLKINNFFNNLFQSSRNSDVLENRENQKHPPKYQDR